MATGLFISYLRVSTDRQGRSGLGLEAQRKAVAEYLNGGNWKIIEEFVEVESGRDANRPALARALGACRVHRAPLVVAKVDRLTRSLGFLTRLIEAGVDVRFADLPQIEGPTGRFMLQQMAAVAELEAGLIGKRTKEALAAARARGQKLGGVRRGQRLSEDMRALGRTMQSERSQARAADLRPIIGELRAAGVTSLGSLAKALTGLGVPTARGSKQWSAMQVQRVIQRLE
jgi:DNA invertase Pin-like site-specific DNA recombinase